MDILELMKYRRTIRKYEEKQVDRETLEVIIEVGLYAPNAGGRTRCTWPVGIPICAKG